MKFDAMRTLREQREQALEIWKHYADRVKAGETFLNGIRDLFDLEVRALDFAITKLGKEEDHADAV